MENYFMNYDVTTGNILGFYLKSIHGDNIPSLTIEITLEKHDFYMVNNGLYRLNPTTLEDELIPIVVQPVEKTELEKLQEENNNLNVKIVQIEQTSFDNSTAQQDLLQLLIEKGVI